jgi:AcrR family transcriptional regulator
MTVAGERLEGAALLAHPIAAAVIAVVRERGYEFATAAEFQTRAGMSEGEFGRQFESKADATLRVLEACIADFKARVGDAYRAAGPWPESLRAAAYEVARWMRDHPDATWFGLIAMLDGGEMARVRREQTFLWAAQLIDAGREVAPDPAAVPASASLLAVGAVVENARRQEEGSIGGVTVRGLMYGAVRPYLGEDAARAELEIPLPPDFAKGGAQGREEPERASRALGTGPGCSPHAPF